MKRIFGTFCLIIIFSCNSQNSNLTDKIIGDWNVVHIFQNDEEILNNNFKEYGWFPKYNRTKKLFIHPENLNLYLDRHGKPILANISYNDSLFYITNSTDPNFNGDYKFDVKSDTVNQEDVRTAYYFLTLSSNQTKILAVKNQALTQN